MKHAARRPGINDGFKSLRPRGVLRWQGDDGIQRRTSSCFFSSRRRHTRCSRDWSSDVCSSDLSRWEGHRLREDRLQAARQDAEQRAAAAEAELATLRETVGAAVEEVQRRLRELEQRLEHTRVEQREADKMLGATEERVQLLAASIEDPAGDRSGRSR